MPSQESTTDVALAENAASNPKSSTIVIRPYRPSDNEQVCEVFSSSMRTLHPAFASALFRTPQVILAYSSWAAAITIGTLRRAIIKGATKEKRSICLHDPAAYLSLAAVIAALTLPLIGFKIFMTRGLEDFLRNSLNSDLSNIETVYGENGGLFLVAEDRDGKIVGTVGGEAKGDGVFELRRMTVSPSARKQRVAWRLITALENHTKPNKIFLTCSSVQFAANELYEKVGFKLVKRFAPKGMPFLFYRAFHIRLYEKYYNRGSNNVSV